MFEFCASVLAANHAHIARDIAKAESFGIRRFHFDVCDGHFTRDIFFGPQLVQDVRKESASFFDVHLAVYNMAPILDSFLDSGVNMINIQFESCDAPDDLIKKIHANSLEASISFALTADFAVIRPYLDTVEVVNLLAVNPGYGGQQFSTNVLEKIEMAADYIRLNNLKTKISVDGGVNEYTIRDIIHAGTDIAIAGSGIFSGDIERNITVLQDTIKESLQHKDG